MSSQAILVTSSTSTSVTSSSSSSVTSSSAASRQQLIDDALFLIFSKYLSMEDLGSATDVCVEWRGILKAHWKSLDLTDLQALFPKCTSNFSPEWWVKNRENLNLARHGLTVPSASRRPKYSMILEMIRFSALRVEGNAGFSRVTLPPEMTLNKLIAIARAPGSRNPIGFYHINPRILKKFGNVPAREFGKGPVGEHCEFLITNSVLEKSRNLSAKDQQALVAGMGYKMTGFLKTVALVVLMYKSSPEGKPPTYLYNTNPRPKPYRATYARNSDKIDQHLFLGGLSPAGLYADISPPWLLGVKDELGVGGQQDL